MSKEYHTIEPFYFKNSKILILGSFPSVQSRAKNFYYAHHQNQFWKLLSDVFEEKIQDKKKFLEKYRIALWDVIESCEIKGSSDQSIKDVKLNKVGLLISNTQVETIFVTGKKIINYMKSIWRMT